MTKVLDLGDSALNLAAFRKGTRMTGPGLRDALWVQGCSIRCPGCANRDYLPHEPRVIVPMDRLLEHFASRRHLIDGCTVLGGEPTEQAGAVVCLLRGVKSIGLSTVVFTGRTLGELRARKISREMLACTDLLVDGPFVRELYDPALHWRGSSNQKLHLIGDRFSEKDIRPEGPNGEILLSHDELTLHGVGTAVLR